MTSAGNTDPGPPKDMGSKFNQEIEDATRKLEQECERLITYLNSEVVPAIRTHSSKALRTAAEKMARMADYMDKNNSR
jgi:ribosomal protein S15P/S13E